MGKQRVLFRVYCGASIRFMQTRFACLLAAWVVGAGCGGSQSGGDGGVDGGDDGGWQPAVYHVDVPFAQERAALAGEPFDARALALCPDGSLFAGAPDGVLRFDGQRWQPHAVPVAGAVHALACDAQGRLAVAAAGGAAVGGAALELPPGAQPRFVAPRPAGGFWVAGDGFGGWADAAYQGIAALDGRTVAALCARADGSWLAAGPEGVWSAERSWTADHGLPQLAVRDLLRAPDGTIWAGTAAGLAELAPGAEAFSPWLGEQGLHQGDVSRLAVGAGGALLVATPLGGSLYRPDGSRRYYFGRNWLPADAVRDMARDADGSVWLATPAGVSRVRPVATTLAERAARIDAIVQQRHVRLGYTSTQCPLAEPGQVDSAYGIDDDNDGQWTGMYLASQCFRYAVTGEAQARDNARNAAYAMLRLERVTGIDGFFARSVVAPEQCPAKQASGSGEWHLSADEQWCWKGDTSGDEFVGHMFGLSLFHDLVADAEQRADVAATLGRILGYLIDNGFMLLDVDGEPTSHGHFDPEWMENDLSARFGDAGLYSAMILGGLRAAYHATGEQRFQDAFELLIQEHGYADYVRRIEQINTAWHINHDSEEMSFLALYTLIRYEDDPERMALWQEGLEGLWQVQRPERNPEFNLMYGALSRRDEFDLQPAVTTLQKMPRDLILWGLDSSQRWDLDVDPQPDRHGDLQNRFVLPYDEREVQRWAENPYRLIQPGDGGAESAGLFYLLPYWLGRHHGLIR